MNICNFGAFKKEKGFTLIELLIVILILVVLAAIAIPSYLFINDRAKETATETEMNNIAKALEVYLTDNNVYPTEGDFPDALETSGFMDDIPENDNWENAYQYSSASGASYVMESYGINGVDGGSDDIVFANGIMTEDGAYSNQ